MAAVAVIGRGGTAIDGKAANLTVSGPARVIDGDTVVVGTTHVRLKGVDAAELKTLRGEEARRVMVRIVGAGTLTCTLTGERTYNREVGFCLTPAGVDINRAILEAGAALSCPRYDTRYVQFEKAEALAVGCRTCGMAISSCHSGAERSQGQCQPLQGRGGY